MGYFWKITLECKLKGGKRYLPEYYFRITNERKVSIQFRNIVKRHLIAILNKEGAFICDNGCGSCIVCDLFGYPSRRGRIFIDNLNSEKAIIKPDVQLQENKSLDKLITNLIFKGTIQVLNGNDSDLELIKKIIQNINDRGLIDGYSAKIKITNAEKKSWADFLVK